MSAVEFQDETREQSLFKQADYDESTPADLVLEIPKRTGGLITLPLLQRARANEEREDVQENTLIRIKPLAELSHNNPVKSGGVTTYTGRSVALVRPGYLYIFQGQTLWRELQVSTDGSMSDVDLARYRNSTSSTRSSGLRESEGEWTAAVVVPVLLQGRAVMHEYRIAYSEVQWSESRIQALEADTAALNRRTASIAPAYVAVQPDTPQDAVTFERGFPAQAIGTTPPLRQRDLGIELMLENSHQFTPNFEQPGQEELCQRLANRLASITEEGEEAPNLDISTDAASDALASLRESKGIACIAVPDVLFEVRHSLAQIHLALQYLDTIEISLKDQPLAHSATLIRQAIFDRRPDGSRPLADYGEAVDKAKLDEVLQTAERQYAVDIINTHVRKLKALMENGLLDTALADYLTQEGIGVCEAYGLCADHLNTLQKIPGILAAHGQEAEDNILSSVSRWIMDNEWLAVWAPTATAQTEGMATQESPHVRLQRLAADEMEVAEAHQQQLHLQSLALLEQQVQLASQQSPEQHAKHAGQVGKLVSDMLSAWSGAVLGTVQRLIEEGHIEAIHLPRLFQGVAVMSVISDPTLEGIEVMPRGSVDLQQRTIIGVHGDGLSFGLTPFDRTEGMLKRGQDYLYADVLNGNGQVVGSTSTQRAAEEIEEAIKKVSMDTWVFTVPAGHPEVQKLSLTRVNLATKVGKVVDGPAVSRALVGLAAFNVFIEILGIKKAFGNDNVQTKDWFKLGGSSIDLIAASMKLKIISVAASGSEIAQNSTYYRVSNRILFDLKGVPLIGARLIKLRASTLVRTVGLVAFIGGVVGVGLSTWDMRSSLSRGDEDAAKGHALAVAGGSILTLSPIMGGLLAIPGWGWAVLGIGLLVGGSLFANYANDGSFERLLKNGPMGTHPVEYPAMPSDTDYYGQLLSLLTPVQAKAQRYADIEPDPALGHRNPTYNPQPDDYVVTLTTPLVSQLRHLEECRPGEPLRTFSIVVQEVAYTESKVETGKLGIDTIESTALSEVTPLTQITARQSIPQENAVRFLVKRNLRNNSYQAPRQQTTIETRLRIAVQAAITSEAGTLVYPTPLFETFAPYDPGTHGQAPPKERSYLNPYSNASVPYWFVTEVEV